MYYFYMYNFIINCEKFTKEENKKMGKLKKQNAITLVALVITIVVLLILAGISISALTNTGIFAKAKDAKKKFEDVELEQNTELDSYEKEISNYLPERKTVKQAIK